tara:strand:- start:41 stop:247 length:207 start_codon:yes stop_codon:yes gene_type:complete
MKNKMNCWHCGSELIWGADHDMEDINDGEESEFDFYSTFSCATCHSYVEVFHSAKGDSNNTLIRQIKK